MWEQALTFARATGNSDLAGNIVADFAYRALWTGEPADAALILEGALTRPAHPRVRALMHLRKARAHAELGEAATCRTHMAKAEIELGCRSVEPPPAWVWWMDGADLEADGGRCQLDMGDTRAGLTRMEHGISLLQPHRDKTKSVFLAYTADAHLQRGEAAQGIVLAGQALDIAERIGATRCVDLIGRFARGIDPSRRIPGAHELISRLPA